jgi:hypothetical protein
LVRVTDPYKNVTDPQHYLRMAFFSRMLDSLDEDEKEEAIIQLILG